MLKTIDRFFAKIPFFWLLFIGFGLLYLLIHLTNLTSLPVFADEAIYIRWAQLIIDKPQEFALYSLNDGKTPLFIWLMVPFQFLFSDQLYAARIVSVWVGLLQVLVMMKLAQEISGKRIVVITTAVLSVFVPFWFFYHRMALMDSLLTLFLSVAVLMTYRLVNVDVPKVSYVSNLISVVFKDIFAMRVLWLVIAVGLSFGGALVTKLPAILFAPSLVLLVLFPTEKSWLQRVVLLARVGAGLGIGLGVFALLKIHPAFSQLFSRGGDFLYPFSDILLHGGWLHSLTQLPRYINYILGNVSLPVLLFSLLPLFFTESRRKGFILTLAWVIFMAPIWLFGKVVYPRYFMPGIIFITLLAAEGFAIAQQKWVKDSHTLWSQTVAALVIATSLATFAQITLTFVGNSLFFPNNTPFIKDDKTQYLTEWSSGHGLKETAVMLETSSINTKIAVATEGYFGSLPDGLVLYFHRKNVENIYIDGIGQPVYEIPTTFWEKAQGFDQIWLVVNSHRMKMNLPKEMLLNQYCRPDFSPCLQVWNVTSLRPQNN